MSTMIIIGLSGRKLKDHDTFSKSDPYFTLSRPSPNGSFSLLRNSETMKNTLNPDWSDIMVSEMEVCGGDRDLNLRLQVYDDDGKKGPDCKDKLIGFGFFSLKQLEAANTAQSPLQITDGKKSKTRGQILVRTFKVHQGGPGGQMNYPATGSGYQAGGNGFPGQQQPGYPGQNRGHRYPGQGYPGQNPPAMPGYPSQGAPMPGYPPHYPPQPPQGYPLNPSNPPQGNPPYGGQGYPPQQPGGGPGHPPQQPGGGPGYPPKQPGGGPGYPPQQPGGGPGYPPQQPGGGPGYPPQQPGGGPGYPLQQPFGGHGYPPKQPGGGPGYPLQQPGGGPGYPPQQPGGGPGYPPKQPGGGPFYPTQQPSFLSTYSNLTGGNQPNGSMGFQYPPS